MREEQTDGQADGRRSKDCFVCEVQIDGWMEFGTVPCIHLAGMGDAVSGFLSMISICSIFLCLSIYLLGVRQWKGVETRPQQVGG